MDDVLAYMDIPMPGDDLSEDDFEGYLTDDDGDNDEGDSGSGDGDCDGSDGGDSEDSEDGDGNNSGDGKDSSDGDDNSNSLPEYTQHPGCTCNMTNKAPIDFFQLFFTDRILESIVDQTNLAELKGFLTLIIIMGPISFPSIEDCCVTSWPFATFTFSSIMSHDHSQVLPFENIPGQRDELYIA